MATPLKRIHHDTSVPSSSPILPPLDQLLSQPTKKHPLQGVNSITNDVTQAFSTVRSAFWDEQPTIDLTTPDARSTTVNHEEADTSVSIIQIPGPGCRPKRRKGGAKVREKKTLGPNDQLVEAANTTRKPKVGIAGRHFPAAKEEDGLLEGPLALEPAARRRTDWTPPPRNTIISSGSNLEELLSSAAKARANSRDVFGNLLEKFGRNDDVDEAGRQVIQDMPVLKKRKLIEMETVRDPIAIKSPVKPKAPKKKPRTLTELATAAYAVPGESAMPPPASSLLVYFAQKDGADPAKSKAKPRKPRAKKLKKDGTAAQPILLSPNTALRQVANQDFVFGTSSQLAREQSPTLLKDLQAALQASNRTDDDEPLRTPINSDAIEPEPRPKLWDVGARDSDGRLLNLEVIDLVNSDEVHTLAGGLPDPFGYSAMDQRQVSPAGQGLNDQSFPDIEVLIGTMEPSPYEPTTQIGQDRDARVETLERRVEEPPPESRMNVPAITRIPPPQYDLYTDGQLAREVTSYGFKPVKRRTAMIALLSQCWESKTGAAFVDSVNNCAISTTTALEGNDVQAGTATSKASIGKPRGRPRKQSPVAIDPTEPPPSAQPAPPPLKRPRGRPRKNSVDAIIYNEPPPSAQPPPPSPKRARGRQKKETAGVTKSKAASKSVAVPLTPQRKNKPRAHDVVEIPDSESDGSSFSSPFSPPDHTFSSPAAVDVSLSMGDDTELSLTLSPTRQQSLLFLNITEAVTTATRTTDPSKPSWHEKMLMYDPVVLEDFTAWLNAGELTRVGHDGEVSPIEVKKWCESQSLCCLWRESLRGKERKRY